MTSDEIPLFKVHDNCVFVTGSSRSGTELMRQILNHHPHVYIAPETHYFADLRSRTTGLLPAQARAVAIAGFAALRGSAYGLNGAEAALPLVERLKDLEALSDSDTDPDEIFRLHCGLMARDDKKGAAHIWGEKCPRHIFQGAAILDLMPRARIIFMLRDPCAVVASYRDWINNWFDNRRIRAELSRALAKEAKRVRGSASLTLNALMWRAAVRHARDLQCAYGEDRVRIQSFESLVSNPAPEIDRIFAFLDVLPVAGITNVPRVNSSYVAAADSSVAKVDALSGWRSRLAAPEVWWVRQLTGSVDMPRTDGPDTTGPFVGFALRELLRTCTRIPRAVLLNMHRRPNTLRRLLASVGLEKRRQVLY